jgi:glucose-1-phosphate thymidylyltransferase
MDCGNKEAMIDTNTKVLEYTKAQNGVAADAVIENTIIIEPCFIGPKAILKNSIVGPYASIGANTTLSNCIVSTSIIGQNSTLEQAHLNASMVGSFTKVKGSAEVLSLGDYSVI